jgi:hypothetical protein
MVHFLFRYIFTLFLQFSSIFFPGVLFRGRALCLSFTPRDDVEFALAAPFDTSAGVVPGAMTPVAATRADIAVSSATGTSAASAFAMAAAGRTILQ